MSLMLVFLLFSICISLSSFIHEIIFILWLILSHVVAIICWLFFFTFLFLKLRTESSLTQYILTTVYHPFTSRFAPPPSFPLPQIHFLSLSSSERSVPLKENSQTSQNKIHQGKSSPIKYGHGNPIGRREIQDHAKEIEIHPLPLLV